MKWWVADQLSDVEMNRSFVKVDKSVKVKLNLDGMRCVNRSFVRCVTSSFVKADKFV